jgi:ribosomal protein S18 acetylase RimI-like enzyme
MVSLVAKPEDREGLSEAIFAVEDELLSLGCRRQRLAVGLAVVDPAHPAIYDVNSLRDVRGTPAWSELEEAFRLVRERGSSRHMRCISRDRDTIRWLDAMLLDRSFSRQACVSMALLGPPPPRQLPRGLEIFVVAEGDRRLLEAVAHSQDLVRREEPWYAREVSRQMDEMSRRQMELGGAELVAAATRMGEVAAALLLFRSGDVAFIADVGTAPRWRRRGIASALISAAAALSQERGATVVGLTARRDEPPRRIYEALGFAATGESIDWLRGV